MDKVIILAAGEGTRMKSEKSKVLHEILGKPLLAYVIDAALISDETEIITVLSENYDQVTKAFSNITPVLQPKGQEYPYGTGFAVKCAVKNLEPSDNVIILNGDIPLITRDVIKEFLQYHKDSNNDLSVLSTSVKNPTGYGRIILSDNNELLKIVEEKDANDDERKVNLINTGIYAFKASKLINSLNLLDTKNSQNELYLTDCVEILCAEKSKVAAYICEDSDYFYGINNKLELYKAEMILQMRINKMHMLNGVIIHHPESVFIDQNTEIEQDTEVFPNTIIRNSKIGKRCVIKSNSRIEDSILHDDVIIDNSVIEQSEIHTGSDVGPFAHLRPNAKLMEKVHIGNFVEVKNSTVGSKTKAGHLAYIGDSDLGENINIGCGVIFVNYDGKNKHRSIVEDEAFIGSNSNIVSPVHIKKQAFIAAGSTITRNVDEGQLSIERSTQKNIDGYVKRKKQRDKAKEK